MVNAAQKNFSPIQVYKYGKMTKKATHQSHQANEGYSGLEAEWVLPLVALCNLRSKKKLAVEKRQKTQILNNAEKETWIEDFVEKGTAVARKRVQYAETAMMQVLKDMTTATWKPETPFEEMLNAIGDSPSDLASSDDQQHGEDEEDDEEEKELGKLNDDIEPGWVMGTISKTVQHGMESFRHTQIRFDELT